MRGHILVSIYAQSLCHCHDKYYLQHAAQSGLAESVFNNNGVRISVGIRTHDRAPVDIFRFGLRQSPAITNRHVRMVCRVCEIIRRKGVDARETTR